MPAIALERVPLPSLQTYTSISVLLLACCIWYAHQIVTSSDVIIGVHHDVDKVINHIEEDGDGGGLVSSNKPSDDHFLSEIITNNQTEIPPDKSVEHLEVRSSLEEEVLLDIPSEPLNITLPYDSYIWNMLFIMTTELWCVWTLVNTAYCCLILLAKGIQKVVFEELRVSEQQHLKDKFWNFVFYKFIFVFGVMNVQTMEEVVLWVAWFSTLGFFHLMTQLCKDRFEYLSFSPTTPRISHIKLLVLLCIILISCFCLMAVCIYTGFYCGITILAFMAAECFLLTIRTLHVVTRYIIHLFDMNLEGVWENRSTYVYFTELIFELAALSVDFCHHLHMLLWGNVFLSMASLVICMQLRFLFYEFQRRIKRHKNYLRVVKNMDAKFPMATREELDKNADNCAICWEKMDAARKLPCGHLFHNACLRSSLEQDTACPTCRMSLGDEHSPDTEGTVPQQQPNVANENQANNQANNQALVNHFFHFDGSRYVSWLPSFSVEVTHTSLMSGQQQQPRIQSSQLDNMARQVQSVFPTMPLATIIEDLRVTRSVDLTIDNILEGRLVAPPTSSLGLRTNEDNEVSQTTSETYSSEGSSNSSTPTEDLFSFTSFDEDEDVDPIAQIDDAGMMSSDNTSTDLVVDSSSLHISGGRFSKSSVERMEMLNQRKTEMMNQARRKYLSKYTPENDNSLSDMNNIDNMKEDGDTSQSRRNLILEATERRLNHPSSD